MKILVTGANGFVGKNLKFALKTKGHTVYEYDIESTKEQLEEYCSDAEFVFHLAGVNRPLDPKEFYEGNCSAA
ncbi:MAG: NAD-dependent epimerase/dehydratase family protein, partial [Clostridia bacterium]|nr:NAD-dependent epimerase/dehydratase family protein [Clostridia bacterium]